MAGMTDTAFRRLVKRHGGCGLVVTEMVSSEGLVRGIDRTLEYAEYTEEERPVSIQIFGGDPEKMAAAAQIVEGMGADIVDVNMGCPVPKIAKHNAGCSLMREPEHAATRHQRDGEGGEDSGHREDARGLERSDRATRRSWRGMVQDAGAAAVTIHGRTAEQSYSGLADWDLVSRRGARPRRFRCSAAATASSPSRSSSGLRSRRRAACSSAAACCAIRGSSRRPRISRPAARRATVTLAERGQFLLDYIDLLVNERVDEADGFRHLAVARRRGARRRGRERWVINKVRALCAWYSKGIDSGPTCASESTARRAFRSSAKSSKNFSWECAVTAVPGVSGERLCG